ncbi:MAG: MATE family efflux transporter [Microscillaceae bacterium]|nr:MATE family efflux transporter [Microscillaceae bacterium]MDW8459802.1 MATE family efflux transporter [Cytophagales bacterium]
MRFTFIRLAKTWQAGYCQEFTTLLRLSLPIIIGQLGTVLLALTDILMISPLGKVSLAAVGLANSVFFLIAVVGIGITSVITPLVSKAKARGDIVECSHLFVQGQKVAFLAGLIILFITLIVAYFAPWFGQEAEVEQIFQSFLIVLGFSAVPMIWFYSLKNFADGLSQTQVAMHITFATVVVNGLLNYVFIYGLPPVLPALQAQGAAISTLLARLFMSVAMYAYIRYYDFFRVFISQISFWEKNSILFQHIWQMGIPAGLQFFFEIGSFTGASILMGWLGSASLAAHQVALNLATISYLIAFSFAIAGSIRVAEGLGLSDKKQMLKAANTAAFTSITFMTFCCLLFLIFTSPLVRLFTQEPTVVAIAIKLLSIAAFFQISDGTQVVFLGLLRGIGDMKIPTYITLVAYWLLSLPISYLLAFTYQLQAIGIWIGLWVGLTTAALLLSIRFYVLLHYRFNEIPKKELVEA